jgi:RHS repeat-associated protein
MNRNLRLALLCVLTLGASHAFCQYTPPPYCVTEPIKANEQGCQTGKANVGKNQNTSKPKNVNPSDGKRMPLWAMTPTSMNLFMKDIPLWYTPPFGPAVEFRMSYNSLDTASRPADFGPKWNLNYHSFCVWDDLYQIVDVYMPDGGIYPYGTNTITGGYIAPARSFNTLTNLVNGGYQLTFPDGTRYTYAQQNSENDAQWLLTLVTDRYGQALTLHYADDPVCGTQLTSVEDALSQSSTLEYNDAGLIQSITDPFGRSMTMIYTDDGYLDSCTDMGGIKSRYEFYRDGVQAGMVKAIRTADGSVSFQWQLTDDPDGPCGVTATYADGSTQQFSYNAQLSGTATSATDGNGQVITYYLGVVNDLMQGSIIGIRAPDYTLISYLYNNKLQVTNVNDQAGNNWQYAYNSAGSLTNFVAPDGYQLSYQYADNGVDVVRIIEGGTVLMGLGYNGNRDVTTVTNALNQVSTFAYDGHGQLTDITDAASINAHFAYGNDQRLTSITRAGTQVAEFLYDNIGRTTNSTGPDNLPVAMNYDNLDRLISLTLPGRSANVLQYENNSLELEAATDDVGRRALFAYNLTRQLSTVVGPDQSQVKLGYDKQGQMTDLTDTLGRRTSLSRDNMGRAQQKTYPGGGTEAWGYTPTGLMSTSQNSRGTTTLIGYTSVGLPTGASYDDNDVTPALSWNWDISRHVVTNSSDGWAASSYEYDALKRLKSVTENGSWGSNRFDYAYDVLGRVTGVTWRCNALAQPLSTGYAYDNLGRMTNVTHDTGAFGYTYANAGLLVTQMTRPDNSSVGYGYDGLLRLTSVLYKTTGGAVDGRWSYGYDAASRIQKRTDPAGRVFNYSYDVMDRLTEALGMSNTSVVAGYPVRYVYDRMGNRLAQAEAHQQQGLTVNSDNQTTARGNQGLEVIGWVNEPVSSVKAKTDSMSGWQPISTRYASTTQTWFTALGLPATNIGANTLWVQAVDRSGNASTSVVNFTRSSQGSSESFGFDADGNRTSSAAGSFAWDAENQLIRMDPTGGGHQECKYDGAGRLRELREYDGSNQLTNTTCYVWNGWLLWAELYSNTTVQVKRTYTWGPDVNGTLGGAGGIGGLVANHDYVASTTQYYRHDGLGNVTEVRAAVDNSVLCRYTYSPFGQVVVQEGTYQQPFRFQTKLFVGGCGLGYWGYRWYDPASGLWLSKDPLREAGGLNMYAYCVDDPLDCYDPTGLKWWREWQVLFESSLGLGSDGSFSAAWSGAAEGYARGGQGIVNTFTGGLFDPNSGLFYDTFNRQWQDMGKESNDCNDQFKMGMTSGRVAEGALLAAGLGWGSGYSSRLAIHEAHHTFGNLGKLSHIQANLWKVGVRGSGKVIRIPLPYR